MDNKNEENNNVKRSKDKEKFYEELERKMKDVKKIFNIKNDKQNDNEER